MLQVRLHSSARSGQRTAANSQIREALERAGKAMRQWTQSPRSYVMMGTALAAVPVAPDEPDPRKRVSVSSTLMAVARMLCCFELHASSNFFWHRQETFVRKAKQAFYKALELGHARNPAAFCELNHLFPLVDLCIKAEADAHAAGLQEAIGLLTQDPESIELNLNHESVELNLKLGTHTC